MEGLWSYSCSLATLETQVGSGFFEMQHAYISIDISFIEDKVMMTPWHVSFHPLMCLHLCIEVLVYPWWHRGLAFYGCIQYCYNSIFLQVITKYKFKSNFLVSWSDQRTHHPHISHTTPHHRSSLLPYLCRSRSCVLQPGCDLKTISRSLCPAHCTVEVLEWISNFIPDFIMDIITYPCWD